MTAHVVALALYAVVACATAAPLSMQVRLDPGATSQAVSGRLLVFAIPAAEAVAQAKDGKVEKVDASAFKPTQVSIAAREVVALAPGASIAVDADAIAFPAGFSQLPKGDYYLQAVLDVNHDYNYGGRGPGDVVSEPVLARLGGKGITLSLVRTLPGSLAPSWELPADLSKEARTRATAALENAQPLDFASPALSAFWGRPTHLRGWVLLPPGYASQPAARYPTVYYTHGFGGSLPRLIGDVSVIDERMRDGSMPPMIWVFLDESSPTGTHEFADSVNNGPWGHALTAELIPMLESKYRMDAKASGRFLNGHSSGGWAALWLQVSYPKLFGGSWPTSPDPGDFRDFTGADLYAANANVYRLPDGSPMPLVRDKGKVIATFEQFARLERVLGEYGGQLASFDWVFSPRGADGRPMPMFDRDTGAVDPAVAAYWRQHYDISDRLKRQWPTLGKDLDGKLHIIIGDADTFHLDGAARKLQQVLQALGAKPAVTLLPGRTHFDVYAIGDDRRGLFNTIAWEMYAIARPNAQRPTGKPQP
ncbi:MAG: alpha/beta hydrolase [Pseudoxanthomonas sp.]